MDNGKPRARPAEISVIVVNYGTADLASAAVQSVLDRNHGGRAVDVHLVDNASPGADREILSARVREADWRDRVIFYPEKVNHGFGRGNNLVLKALAARETPPRYVFLLNPDARIENEALDLLAGVLDATPEAAFAGAGISKPESGPVPAAFRFPGFFSEFTQILGIGPIYRLFGRWQVALPPNYSQGQVDWVSGAAVMMRLEVLEEIGFFDPAFFLYYEETDLMRRAVETGWQTWYVPAARAVHAEGVSTGVRSDDSLYPALPTYWYQSWAHYFHKAKGRWGASILGFCVLLAACLRILQMRLRGKPAMLPENFIPDFWRSAVQPLLTGHSPLV